MFDKLQKMIDSLDDQDVPINDKIKVYNEAKKQITQISSAINDVYHDVSNFKVKKTKINKKTEPMSLYDTVMENQDKLKNMTSLEDSVLLYKDTMVLIEQLTKWLENEENKIYQATETGKTVDIMDITELFIDKAEAENTDETGDSEDEDEDDELDEIVGDSKTEEDEEDEDEDEEDEEDEEDGESALSDSPASKEDESAG
jgi:exonuclease VII small subunit